MMSIPLFFSYSSYFGITLIFFILNLVHSLLKIAFGTLGERVLMAAMQRRQGPNVVGIGGILQPIADGLKLLVKEIIVPEKAHITLFFISPALILLLNLSTWIFLVVSPYSEVDFTLVLLLILVFNIIEIYGIMFAGWSSNSKYALIGAVRSSAQMISYEISLSFVFLSLLIVTGSTNTHDWILWQILHQHNFACYLFPFVLIYIVSMLAETNRAPFDLPEAEAEIVAGYNVEYSGFLFALFFLGEYSNMLFLSYLSVTLFFGSGFLFIFPTVPLVIYTFVFTIVSILIFYFLIWVRATLPRYRYDQLMDLGWKVFLPITFGCLLFLLGELSFSLLLF